MEETEQIIPYRSKVAYELVFLEAIKDIRKQRVNSPDEGFANAVVALNLVLLPLERKKVDEYKLDYLDHKKELESLKKKLSIIKDEESKQAVYLNELKKISWQIYCKELDKLYEEKKLKDQNLDGLLDKTDLIIMKYNGLFEKIISVLKEGDWLIKGSDITIGGGGHGLDENR